MFPLEAGIGLLVDGLFDRIGELGDAIIPKQPETALAGAAGPGTTTNLNVGTLVADDRGLKLLERKLDRVRIAENQRKGF